jgi:hypothetical protein
MTGSMMRRHSCARCGWESTCDRGGWVDRHPAAAVTAGLFGLVWMSMMLSVYPLAAATLLTIGAAVWFIRAATDTRRRRDALAARADWEHRKLMARAMFSPVERPRRLSRQRGADHWSPTEPLKANPAAVRATA